MAAVFSVETSICVPHDLFASCIVLFNEERQCIFNLEGVTDLLWFAVIHPL